MSATHFYSNGNGDICKPVCLSERFGGKFRISMDPAYYAEHGPRARVLDPWLEVAGDADGRHRPTL